ncbi:DUF5946 family protein [Paenibacillus dendritiformis]|uniref:DUF5946 family protein n=1 Tax=Paenibacillus dendritiformis TaxID=130049 RepID=UPI001F5538C6|nr:DUF5946 family protein [Paenibacillus dendritiformis]
MPVRQSHTRFIELRISPPGAQWLRRVRTFHHHSVNIIRDINAFVRVQAGPCLDSLQGDIRIHQASGCPNLFAVEIERVRQYYKNKLDLTLRYGFKLEETAVLIGGRSKVVGHSTVMVSGRCAECGAQGIDGFSCDELFGFPLAWEHRDPQLYALHFWLVACYMIQHPSNFTEEGYRLLVRLFIDAYDNERDTAYILKKIASS